MSKLVVYVATIVSVLLSTPSAHQPGEPFGLITKKQTDCEMDALVLGGRLADAFNSFDEATERDVRLHHDYLAENLGFVRWMQSGLWKNTGMETYLWKNFSWLCNLLFLLVGIGLTADRKSAKEAQQVLLCNDSSNDLLSNYAYQTEKIILLFFIRRGNGSAVRR